MLNAKVSHGGVTFESLPLGAGFFFGGQFILANEKVGMSSYKAPCNKWTLQINPATIVYPDTRKYIN